MLSRALENSLHDLESIFAFAKVADDHLAPIPSSGSNDPDTNSDT